MKNHFDFFTAPSLCYGVISQPRFFLCHSKMTTGTFLFVTFVTMGTFLSKNQKNFVLQQNHIVISAGFPHVFRPQAGLNFTYVYTAQEQHAQAGLADTAADGVRKILV